MTEQYRINPQFKEQYDKLFEKSPAAVNLYLLLYELAYINGFIKASPAELAELMPARFEDPLAYNIDDYKEGDDGKA